MGQIADQARLPVSAVSKPEITRLLGNLSAHPGYEGRRLQNKYFDRTGKRDETIQQIVQRSEVLLGIQDPLASSYGLYTPSYLYALVKQRNETPQDGSHTSLLVGALTPDSVKEYATTVRTVHPVSDLHVIDLDGDKTRTTLQDVVTFREGDALHMPFTDGQFNSLHTNILLDHLDDTQGSSPHQREQHLFSEAYRVLRTGGMLVMVEHVYNPQELQRDLAKAGFAGGMIMDASSFTNRRVMEQYMRSTALVPLPETTRQRSDVSLIIAAKAL